MKYICFVKIFRTFCILLYTNVLSRKLTDDNYVLFDIYLLCNSVKYFALVVFDKCVTVLYDKFLFFKQFKS